MRMSRNSKVSAALICLTLLGAAPLTGCSDQQESGTAVTDTPEAQAGRKASMDGMKAIMQPKGQASGKQKPK